MSKIKPKKIGIFYILSSIFGGLFVCYALLGSFILVFPNKFENSIVIAFVIMGILWAFVAFWILISKTKKIAIYKILGSLVLFLIIYCLKKIA